MLMVFEIAPEMNGCDAAIMWMWLSTERITLALACRTGWRNRTPADARPSDAARLRASSLRRRARWRRRCPSSRSRGASADRTPASLSVALGIFSVVVRKLFAERPLVEHELDVEGGLQRALELGQRLVGEALGLQRGVVDRRRLTQRAVTDGVGLDLGDLALAIAERAQRFGHGLVDDLEVAAAGELLELHQREVRLDAGRIAIHDEADRAGRRDHGRLRVAIAVLLAEFDGAVPGAARGGRAGSCRRSRRGRAAPARSTASRSR